MRTCFVFGFALAFALATVPGSQLSASGRASYLRARRPRPQGADDRPDLTFPGASLVAAGLLVIARR